MKNLVVLLIALSSLAGCSTMSKESFTMEKHGKQFRSLDIRVPSECVMRTSITLKGIRSKSKEIFERYGRVYYYPQEDTLVYTPRLSYTSMTRAMIGMVPMGYFEKGSKVALIKKEQGGYRLYYLRNTLDQNLKSSDLVETSIFSKRKDLVKLRGATLLQNGDDPFEECREVHLK